jgi:predicted nucleic acid-binding protein
MTLLDASVIADALRAKDLHLMAKMKEVRGAICGVSRAEVLSGARGPRDRDRLRTILDGFLQISISNDLWDEVGALQAELRAGGVTVPLADAVVAGLAQSMDMEIWARDAHFRLAQQILPALKLYREST